MTSGPSLHLSWDELACHNPERTPYPECWREVRLVELAEVFEDFRTFMGDKPLIIGSAYRTQIWNRRQGGSKYSQHVEGRALDLKCPRGMRKETFRDKAKIFASWNDRVGGLGWYVWGVHLDVRPRPDSNRLAFWSCVNKGTRIHDGRV